jgi:ornithine carbamoyltransferase
MSKQDVCHPLVLAGSSCCDILVSPADPRVALWGLLNGWLFVVVPTKVRAIACEGAIPGNSPSKSTHTIRHGRSPARGCYMRDFLSVADLSIEELQQVLDLSVHLKKESKQGQWRTELAGKTVALLFQKPSLRTRVSFEQGIRQLGGHSMYLSPAEVQLGERESVPDVARVLSRYVDCIVARVNRHSDLKTLAEYSTVPVINALSDLTHPCQGLADLLTVREHKDRLAGVTMAYIGDGNNVAHSLILGAAKSGMHLRIACPEGYEPLQSVVDRGEVDRQATGATLTILHDPAGAAKQADVLYTDVWASMGHEAEKERRRNAFAAFRIDAALVALAKPEAVVMHDLPAHRGEEITDEVIDGPQSVVFDQAENRLHAQKGLISFLFAGL